MCAYQLFGEKAVSLGIISSACHVEAARPRSRAIRCFVVMFDLSKFLRKNASFWP
jgi:hypothetical protein